MIFRIMCALGFHKHPYCSWWDLLNETRPWCWHIVVQCNHCRKKIYDVNLDERDAEAFLEKRKNAVPY